MACELFQYTDGYDYDEFSDMCNRFKNIKLPFLKGYDINRLLAGYIFGYSMKRFPVGIKHTFRRFIASLFLYPLTVQGEGKTALVFTGDGIGRLDYIACVNKVAKQCDDAAIYSLNRTTLEFRVQNIFGFIPELLWAVMLNKWVNDFNVSLDMAVGLYRAKKQGEFIFRHLRKDSVNRIVTFCDVWSTESVITQKALKQHIPTATLQHGNGTDILYGSCSDFYLANSKLSRKHCMHAGIPERKIILAGPMKYAGERFEYKPPNKLLKIGVVLDGAQNFDNNVQMLETIHKALDDSDACLCIRFHPNNRREDYQPYIDQTDEICDDLSEFENMIDLCIVYNSSMYTDMIYKKVPVYRFKNGKIDLFPELDDRGFHNAEELRGFFGEITGNQDKCFSEQQKLYDQVFGLDCQADSYKRFFTDIF